MNNEPHDTPEFDEWMATPRTLTPYLGYGLVRRVELSVSPADDYRFNQLPKDGLRHEDYRETVTVTHLPTGEKYVLRRADCGCACYCAAEIVTGNTESLRVFV